MDNLIKYNIEIAAKLEEVAGILEQQKANRFRVQAYRNAAETIRESQIPVDAIVEKEGIEGLDKLPGIGESLSRTIFQLVKTGRLPMLDRLRGATDPVAVLASIPGIGKRFAEKLHDVFGIHSLEELEAAAYDGRLADLAGFGTKRIAGIRDSLSARLGRVRKNIRLTHSEQPSIAEILDIDREYREKVQADSLPMIAPRRFNPKKEAWLPIFHTDRNGHHYTALFSNTAHAHQAHKTRDWVLIYYDGDKFERQYTVITAERGAMAGMRIVRGRERECAAHYFPEYGAVGYLPKESARAAK